MRDPNRYCGEYMKAHEFEKNMATRPKLCAGLLSIERLPVILSGISEPLLPVEKNQSAYRSKNVDPSLSANLDILLCLQVTIR